MFYEVGDILHHQTSKEAFLGGGMGVGLCIVNDIVKAHEGSIEVKSTIDEGSSFIVRLPQDSNQSSA